MTGQRTIILGVVAESSDHPDVEEIYNRASRIDPKIGIATVYRTDCFENRRRRLQD